MTGERMDAVLRAAVAEGLLPADATLPEDEGRPWPVVLLIALGAWLATIPLLIAVGLLLGDWISRGVGPYVVGALLLAGATLVLRERALPVFVEQLALPAVLVGGGALGFGLFRDLGNHAAALVLALLALGIGGLVGRAWLRGLLGALAAVLAVLGLVSGRAFDLGPRALPEFWLAWHAAVLLWLAAHAAQRLVFDRGNLPGAGAAAEAMGAGWLIATLAGLAWLSGMTFLVGAAFEGPVVADIARDIAGRNRAGGPPVFQPVVSAALALAGLAWGARCWPALRQPWWMGVGAVLVGLSWAMPTLGAVLLALIVCATAQRWLLCGTAGVAAAWIVGAFYYQLRFALAEKALLLVAAGVVLGVLAWVGWRGGGTDRARGAEAGDAGAGPEAPAGRIPQWAGIALTLALTLAAINAGIWQKERLIAAGQPVYVELAPVDPRSLMQGDYMRLNFRLPSEAWGAPQSLTDASRPRVVMRRDARGVAVPVRLERPGEVLAADEMRIELAPGNGRWILVTDAWQFREGEAERWAKAKYGEFRVDADGRALLVGMADADLRPIVP